MPTLLMVDKKYKKNSAGFTVIELIVVISILGFVAAISTPYASRSINQFKVKSAAYEIFNALKLERQEAILKHKEKTLLLDIEEFNFTVHSGTTTLNIPKETHFTLLTAESELINSNKGQIRFFHDGSSTGGSISIAYRSKTHTISINWLTGKIEID